MSPEALRNWMSAVGGRRFLMTMGSGIVNTALVVIRAISEQAYVTLTLATVAVYIGANTLQKVKETTSR